LAPEVTYFDPFTEKRVDGREAMQVRLAPMKQMTLPFTDPRYDMIDPKIQSHEDVAILTFNLVNYGKLPNGPERVLARWNATCVYSRIGGRWQIIHSHWSYMQPERKQPGS
jgi:ketosteroid isomerase-like protein